ncbi:MAG TPA: endonuclease domain-containing protein [Chitinophagaceae bacterium]|nr:endonuclease domain-containing protein [Chitinophagaceae bacterium]
MQQPGDSYKNRLHKHATSKIYEYAKALRLNETEAEQLLWQQLRNKKLNGLKFRRQHPLDKWIADFYCHEKKLVIELDGTVHDNFEAKEKDKGRTYELEQLGITTIRFKNDAVLNEMKKVLETISDIAKKL